MHDTSIIVLFIGVLETAVEWLEHTVGLPPHIQERLLTSGIVIAVIVIIRFILLKIVWNRTASVRTRYQWQKGTTYILAGLAFIVIGRIWFEGVHSLATFLGLVSAGIAIALKDVVTGLAGWIFLLWRRPFDVGDRIQIGEYSGDVIDMRIFQFTLNEIGNWVDADQSTGRVIHIPNGLVFTTPQINYTKGFEYIWDEIPVYLTYESDWKRAKEMLLRIVEEHTEALTDKAQRGVQEASKKFMIFYSTLSPTVYTELKDRGITLTMRYLVEPRQRRARQQILWEAILDMVAKEADIEIAYPTTRFYRSPDSPPLT
ncbi:MAG: mechanosensitive ion channel [Bacteroidetes bacterium]|nr:mechanosensitive ion channel [Bacteroidota bacterium]